MNTQLSFALFASASHDQFGKRLERALQIAGANVVRENFPSGDELQFSSSLDRTLNGHDGAARKCGIVVVDGDDHDLDAAVRVAQRIGARGVCFPIVSARGFNRWANRPFMSRETLAPDRFRRVILVHTSDKDQFPGWQKAFWCKPEHGITVKGFAWVPRVRMNVVAQLKEATASSSLRV